LILLTDTVEELIHVELAGAFHMREERMQHALRRFVLGNGLAVDHIQESTKPIVLDDARAAHVVHIE